MLPCPQQKNENQSASAGLNLTNSNGERALRNDCGAEVERTDNAASLSSSLYIDLEAEATGSRDGMATPPGGDAAPQQQMRGLKGLLASDAGVMLLSNLSLRETVQLLSATSKEIARLPASCRGAWMLSLLRKRLGEALKIDASSLLCLDRGVGPPLLGEIGAIYKLAANIVRPCVSMRDVEEETSYKSALTSCQRLMEYEHLQQSTCGYCCVNKLSLKKVPRDRIGTAVIDVDEACQVLALVYCSSASCKYQLIAKLSACERCRSGLTLGGICGCCGNSVPRCEPCNVPCSACNANLCGDCALYGPEPDSEGQEQEQEQEQEKQRVFCTDCGYVCDGCINAYSYNDGVVCDDCGEIACITCWSGALCHTCEEVKCNDCDTMLQCGSCDAMTCTACAEDSLCGECGLPLCSACGVHHEV